MSCKEKRLSYKELWETIVDEAKRIAAGEPILSSFLFETILNHKSLEEALSYHLAGKLRSETLPAMLIREIIMEAFEKSSSIKDSVSCDIQAVRERDPAAKCFSTPLLYFKGFHSLQAYRVAHWLWQEGRTALALCLQNRVSEVFGVDIHPAARIGSGILIDHATGVVIGETAVVGNDVSILHEVTLGGTGKQTGDRHPKVRDGVLIGAGAKILGNIEIGKGAKIGAGSVVLEAIPAHSTAVGVPAKVIGQNVVDEPALEMNHTINCKSGSTNL